MRKKYPAANILILNNKERKKNVVESVEKIASPTDILSR